MKTPQKYRGTIGTSTTISVGSPHIITCLKWSSTQNVPFILTEPRIVKIKPQQERSLTVENVTLWNLRSHVKITAIAAHFSSNQVIPLFAFAGQNRIIYFITLT